MGIKFYDHPSPQDCGSASKILTNFPHHVISNLFPIAVRAVQNPISEICWLWIFNVKSLYLVEDVFEYGACTLVVDGDATRQSPVGIPMSVELEYAKL